MNYAAWLDENLENTLNECSALKLNKGPNQYTKKEYSITADALSERMIWLKPLRDGFELLPPPWLEVSMTLLTDVRPKPSERYGPIWVIAEPQELIRILKALDAVCAKDRHFFNDETEGPTATKFTFAPGHTDREVGGFQKSGSAEYEANRLHNDIQNRLYRHLVGKLGENCVGTEISTGNGTLIDVVTEHGGMTTFFEIKTSPSVRTNIRQALPQLLEYAFWASEERADKLVIVSHLKLTPDAARYLQILQTKFHVPIAYQQFDLNENALC